MTDEFGSPGSGSDPFGSPRQASPVYSPAEERAEVPRDQWDRYLIPAADGTKPAVNKGRLRVTTLAKVGHDESILQDRAERFIVEGLAKNPALNAQAMKAAALPDDDKGKRKALRTVAAAAFDAAGGNEKRDRGTQFHILTEAVKRFLFADGPKVDVPDDMKPEVEAYLAALKKHNLQPIPELMERVVLCPYDTGGCLDDIMRYWNPATEAYELVIVDTKTDAHELKYSRLPILVQLWLYANAYSFYVTTDIDYDDKGKVTAVRGYVEPMPLELRQDKAFVIRAPLDGSAEVLRLDLSGVGRYVAAQIELKRANAEAQYKYTSLGVVRPDAFVAPSDTEKTYLYSDVDSTEHIALTTQAGRPVTPDQQAQEAKAAARLEALSAATNPNTEGDDEQPLTHDPITKRKKRTCGFCRKPGHWTKNCPQNPESPKYVAPADDSLTPEEAEQEITGPIGLQINDDGSASTEQPYCTMPHVCQWTSQNPAAPGQWVCSVSGKPGKRAWEAGQTMVTAEPPYYGAPPAAGHQGEGVTPLPEYQIAEAKAQQLAQAGQPVPSANWEKPPNMIAWKIKQAQHPDSVIHIRHECMQAGTWNDHYEQLGLERYRELSPPTV